MASTIDKNILHFRKDIIDDSKTPINFLEMSVAVCIKYGIMSYREKNSLNSNPFDKIIIYFKNEKNRKEETLTIKCETNNKKLAKDFRKIVKNCYISQHLTFKKKIIFPYLKEN